MSLRPLHRALALALVAAGMAIAVAPASADPAPPPPNFGGELFSGGGQGPTPSGANLQSLDCQPDGISTAVISFFGYLKGPNAATGPYPGSTWTDIATVTFGHQAPYPGSEVTRGPVLSYDSSFTVGTNPSYLVSGTRTMGSDLPVADVATTYGSCSVNPTAPVGTPTTSLTLSQVATRYSVQVRDRSTRQLYAAAGSGLATTNLSLTIGVAPGGHQPGDVSSFNESYGSIGDFAPVPDDNATALQLASLDYVHAGETQTVTVHATRGDGAPAEAVPVLLSASGPLTVTPSNACRTEAGTCTIDYTETAPQAGQDTISACADNNRNQVCDPGEPTAQVMAPWLAKDQSATDPGDNVTVYSSDGNTNLQFGSVTQPGVTTIATSTTGPAPTGFQLDSEPPSYIDIDTTAQFSGPVQICITVPVLSATPAEYAAKRLYHHSSVTNQWEDITTSASYDNGVICGVTTSFSPFVIGHVPTKPSDLTIAQQAPITTPATGPTGATVTYAKPKVTGSAATVPVASCAPASGTKFAIGTTTVTCTASSAAYANSPATMSFSVAVQSATAQLAALRASVIGVGSGKSLQTLVELAQATNNAGQTKPTCVTLGAFSVAVAVQVLVRTVAPATGVTLVATAARIAAVLKC